MGDLPQSASPGAGHAESTSQQNGDAIDGGPPATDSLPAGPDQQTHSQPQHDSTTTKHAFSSQLDMAASPPVGRPGPYNMGNMANALPQPSFRPGQYPQGAQQRYNPASPSMMHQMPQMPQYAGHPPMPMANQAYYIQQPQMPPYYGAGQLSTTQTQTQSPISARQPMAFYPNPMMMNHPQSAYYYPQANQYPGQAQTIPNMMHGQFMAASPTTTDPRMMSQSSENGGMVFHPQKPGQGMFFPVGSLGFGRSMLNLGVDDIDGQQNAVRGPPRKPRQSGEISWFYDPFGVG